MLAMSNGNGNGWHSLRWTLAGALILAFLTGAIAGWRQFTLMEERLAYLLRLNEQQNTMFETFKDGIRALQQQTALNGQTDDVQREKLLEHDAYLREMFRRVRVLEQLIHPTVEKESRP